jgi:hypothetical protein
MAPPSLLHLCSSTGVLRFLTTMLRVSLSSTRTGGGAAGRETALGSRSGRGVNEAPGPPLYTRWTPAVETGHGSESAAATGAGKKCPKGNERERNHFDCPGVPSCPANPALLLLAVVDDYPSAPREFLIETLLEVVSNRCELFHMSASLFILNKSAP